MDIKDIVKMYGKTDYYEMMTGKIFHLSQMKYDSESKITLIPVTQDGVFLGHIKSEGDLTQI